MDYYSNFWEIDELSTTTAPAVIAKLKRHFARYGWPETVISDNGPQFSCEAFATFAKAWEFEHRTISSWNSKANGKVEAAVIVAKQLLRKARDSNGDIHLALLDQRNTPTHGMTTSPAQGFLNRRTKTLLPTKETLLRPAGKNLGKIFFRTSTVQLLCRDFISIFHAKFRYLAQKTQIYCPLRGNI